MWIGPRIATNGIAQATQPLAGVTEGEDNSPNSPSRNFSRPMSPTQGSTTTKKVYPQVWTLVYGECYASTASHRK